MKFSPLTTNPSLVGLNGDFNTIINYRNQWKSVASPFTTFGLSFDSKLTDPRSNRGFLAGGLNFFHDTAGDLTMTTSNVNLSLAYHLKLSRDNTVGLGIQGGYGSRGIKSTEGLFASQYSSGQLDANIPSGESYRGTNFGYFDLGAGIVFNHNSLSESSFDSEGFNLSFGLSAFHLTAPNYSYLQGGKDDLAIRFLSFVDAEIAFKNSDWSLMPALYYQKQGGHSELLLGSYFKYQLIKNASKTSFKHGFSIAYGAFYRFGDAFVNSLLIDWKEYALGISYDLNLSSLNQASKGRGGFEIMLRYALQDGARSKSKLH